MTSHDPPSANAVSQTNTPPPATTNGGGGGSSSFSVYHTPTSPTSTSETPSVLPKPTRFTVARTPSAVDFPGAFTTKPKVVEPHHAAALNKFTIIPNSMKSKVAEAVGGSLANVVDGVYSLVSYVNPLGGATTTTSGTVTEKPDDVLQQTAAAAEAAVAASRSQQRETAGSGTNTTTPPTPDSIDNGESPPSAGMVLQVPSGGTSVAADLDEQCLADANANNPEHNRPPTPTKGAFSRMLRLPAAPVTDPARQASNAEYKQAVQKDPISRNVSQRTGLRFKPGSEEKKRYMRRLSKAPQLDSPEDMPPRRSVSSQRRRRSTSAGTEARASTVASDESGESEESESDDNSHDDMAPDDAADPNQRYDAAAMAQRSASKTHAVEAWRFISPRVKRVKRRVLWRLFLAQEITPAVYSEATTNMAPQKHVPGRQQPMTSGPSSPVMAPQLGLSEQKSALPRRDASGTSEMPNGGSLRRRMLETATMRSNTQGDPRDGNASLRKKQRTPSIAQSVESHESRPPSLGRTQSNEPGSGSPGQKSAIWAMEFSVCGKYLAAGGQDGVVRIWRIAPFAREQEREKKQGPKSAGAATPQKQHSPTHQSRLSQQLQQSQQLHQNQALPPALPRTRTAAATLGNGVDARTHVRQQSVLLGEAAADQQLAYANSAPIARIKHHSRSYSVGQTVSPAEAAQTAQHEAAAEDPDELHPMHAYELLEPVPFRSYVGHTADVLSLSWSKNGFLLSASMDRTVRLWHPHRPECLCTFRHRDIVTCVAFSPRDDRLFISGSLDCRLRLWDIPARGVRKWTGLPDGQMVTAVGFTGPRGDHIVAGTYRGMCVFYATDTLAVLGRMHARSSRGRNARGSKITGFAFAPAGHRLLVSSNDSRLRMFQPSDHQLLRKYKGHANASSQAHARLSADARYIVSGSEDHNIYVWSAAQDNAATVATHPQADHIRRVGRVAARSSAAAASDSPVKTGAADRKQLLAALFGKRRAAGEASDAKPSAADDDDAWESLDGKVEEKSIYEYFPAHDAAVSQALFVPAATLQYLADHDDPILSRPKVRFAGASGEVENSTAASTDGTFGASAAESGADSAAARMVEDMTAIIVSADTLGNIRVFRKDINMRRRSSSHTPATNASCASLLRAKDSLTSLSRHSVATPADDLGSYSMAQSRRSTMTRGVADELKSSLLRPDSIHTVDTTAQRQRPASFWGRLGRRMSQKRTGSVIEGSGGSLRTRVLSGTDQVPPVPVLVAQHPAGPSIAGASDVCAYCGHAQFLEFAVAPGSPASPDSAGDSACHMPRRGSPTLLVCKSCKRVKGIPE
ncbi:WD repeat-containing protein 44 [Coemansia sp. RSA 1933]|nr:WD repeat-containing protein 44 [Coemansia sp. RSA 1933]